MDYRTIQIYNSCAKEIAELHETLIPSRIYQLINKYFTKSGICADIGCGTGRDSAWLFKNGYSVIGIDASSGMLEEAKKHYPNIRYVQDSLPLLNCIKNISFINVLCSAVIMHLVNDDIAVAVSNLLRITAPNGVIILSFRTTDSTDGRENGKLYNNIEKEELISLFRNSGADLIHCEIDNGDSRNLKWTNIVFRKQPYPVV